MSELYSITLNQTLLGETVQNVLYYEDEDSEFDPTEWIDVADEIRGYFNTHLVTHLSDNWAFGSITYRRVDVPGLPSFKVVPSAGVLLGTNATDPLPTQIALLVSAKAATTAPNHVRTYLAGFTDGSVLNGLWGAGATTAAVAWATAMDELNASGVQNLRRISARWNSGHTQVTDSHLVGTLAVSASVVPATQRRRRINQGI